MHVLINYLTNDKKEHEQNFLMQTQDGEEWMLDIVLMESRQRTIISFNYFYQVEDGEGRFMMAGDIVNDSADDPEADINLLAEGYATISCHRLLSHDLGENARLKALGMESDF